MGPDIPTAPRTSRRPPPVSTSPRPRTPSPPWPPTSPAEASLARTTPSWPPSPTPASPARNRKFPGYYADTAPEAGCQVFHICQFDGRHDSFLCPNGTIFNQQYFVCDWWFNVDCAASEQFVSLNADIGKVPDNAAAASDASLATSYSAPQAQASAQVPVQAPNQFYGAPNGF
ncbi:U-scoloptoxin(01)-Er1a-like [Penaeus indicus]|uniref:U-scoloptoxin(01)-Er1a-like n=1 Tax=Penaeus indicus TaxID=29960 RepID=UPI00300CBBC9